jgi:hypothetical protein
MELARMSMLDRGAQTEGHVGKISEELTTLELAIDRILARGCDMDEKHGLVA